MYRRILSVLLAVVFVFSCLPVGAIPTLIEQMTPVGTIAVETKYAQAGDEQVEVKVKLDINENTYIGGALLTVEYDEKLTMTSAGNGNVFPEPTYTFSTSEGFASPCTFLWDSAGVSVPNQSGDVLVFRFKVAEDAQVGERLNVRVSYNTGNIYDNDFNDLYLDTEKGGIIVIDYKPGDVNGDGVINVKDIGLMRQYLTHRPVTINTAAANCNGDNVLNVKDIGWIRKHMVNAESYPLYPEPVACDHVMEYHAEEPETCTEPGVIEYWHCVECDKYFSDPDGLHEVSEEDLIIQPHGHTPVTIPYVAPTATEPGLTEGQKCSECGEIIIPQEEIPPTGCSIEYHMYYSFDPLAVTANPQNKYYTYDGYLSDNAQTLGLTGPNNPYEYNPETGLSLKNLSGVRGYTFDGWYDAEGANGRLVTKIEPGNHGHVELYARWTLNTYTITLDSPDVEVTWANKTSDAAYTATYTVNRGFALANLSTYGYTFIGWSTAADYSFTDKGFIITQVPQGVTENMLLRANWTANRNRATVISTDDQKPKIIEDNVSGRFMFVYQIGRIENVPLRVLEDPINTNGYHKTYTYQTGQDISVQNQEQIRNMVANATTRSSGITLSRNWEDIYRETSGQESVNSKSEERTNQQGVTVGNEYFVSNSKGGSSYVSTSSGASASATSKVTTRNSVGTHGSVSINAEKYFGTSLGVSESVGLGVGFSVPLGVVEVGAEINGTVGTEESMEAGIRRGVAVHDSVRTNSFTGTYNKRNASAYYNTSASSSSNWNSSSGHNSSTLRSANSAVTNAISSVVANTSGVEISNVTGGYNTSNVGETFSQESSDEYSSAFIYGKTDTVQQGFSVELNGSGNGYYRVVEAGTVHVFGIVGYDVATSSYFYSTYSVLDDNTYTYLDFSAHTANFDDCENALVPFSIPFYPCEYVQGVTEKTDGLEFGLEGKVTEYTGSSTEVVVPQYYSANNGVDGSATAVRVTSFDATVFQGNTNIETVILPIYVEEIPANAFKGCTNLKNIVGFGVMKIGANAFEGCTSLEPFGVTCYVTSLGDNAFKGVREVSVDAKNAAVANATINSGADRIILNIGTIEEDYNNKTITVSSDREYFALLGRGQTVNNLKLDSDAGETYISNLSMRENADTPIKVSSSVFTMNRLTVANAPGFAVIMTNDNTDVKLYGDVVLTSASDNTVLCKNVTLSKENNEVQGIIKATGNVLTAGGYDNLNGNRMLTFEGRGSVISISAEDFEKYLSSSRVLFDANGGSVSVSEMRVFYGQPYGELPVPTRTGYGFNGWYTARTGGERITAESVVTSLADQTLYAQWTTNAYTVSWSVGTGCNIKVERTSSPNAGASIGQLQSGSAVYFGDVLKMTYTAKTGYHITEHGRDTVTVDQNITSNSIWARADVNSYTVTWNGGTGYNIVVTRTSSPLKGASTGALSYGSTIYYGDVLSISYGAWTGYSIRNHGSTSITVSGNVNSSNIWASASVNAYTYSIVYRSSNGTNLGSTTATYNYGTTNTIYPPAKTGYNTPGAQTVAWDSVYAKTITFTYSVKGEANPQQMASGTWHKWSQYSWITYNVRAEFANRTSNSVQVRIIWTNDLHTSGGFYGYAQYFTANIGGTSTGEVTICTNSTWNSEGGNRSKTVYSDWITVYIGATSKNIAISATFRDRNNKSGSWSNTLVVPTY